MIMEAASGMGIGLSEFNGREGMNTKSATATATFSKNREYRYVLRRTWGGGGQILFIMLNPSTADEVEDDPTIRRCLGFARSWGFGGLAVANLFAFRTPSPAKLKAAPDPVGPDNDKWLPKLYEESAFTVAAWGNHGTHMGRGKSVLSLLSNLHCLGITKIGEPRHPLYVPASTAPTALVFKNDIFEG